MFRFIKDYFFSLVILLFISFYFSYFITVNYQIFCVHHDLVNGKNFKQINFTLITFVVFGILPILLWKITARSELPILKETSGFRLLLSEIAFVFTIALFISKSIFNSVAKSIMAFDNNFLGEHGKIILVEVLSIAIPLILFLYVSKKVISHFMQNIRE